jgi:hypothetical protein
VPYDSGGKRLCFHCVPEEVDGGDPVIAAVRRRWLLVAAVR